MTTETKKVVMLPRVTKETLYAVMDKAWQMDNIEALIDRFTAEQPALIDHFEARLGRAAGFVNAGVALAFHSLKAQMEKGD